MVIWIYKSKAQAPISFFLGLLTVYLEVDSLRDWVANLQHLIVIETKIFHFCFDNLEPGWLPCMCSLRGPEGRPSKGPGTRCAKPSP